MKLNQIFNQLLEAKFDSRLTNIIPWYRTKDDKVVYIRTGWVDDFEVVVQVKFSRVVSLNITGVAAEFGLRTRQMSINGDDFVYNIKSFPDAPATQIFGAVINVLRGSLPAEWDFMYVITKDSITERIRLYTALFKRFAPTYGMIVDSVRQGNEGGVIMARQQDMEPVKQIVITKFFPHL